jgi:gamma-glutamyl phosphate reductase
MVRSKARKNRSTEEVGARSRRAATVDAVTMKSKSGVVIVLRSSQTGRFTTSKSAHVIDRGAERFAGTLKRLAKK